MYKGALERCPSTFTENPDYGIIYKDYNIEEKI